MTLNLMRAKILFFFQSEINFKENYDFSTKFNSRDFTID